MNVHEVTGKGSKERGYTKIADHGLIGNLRTAALISIDGSVESYCVPHFDSPSVFARILDKDKGGHFSITPTVPFIPKQNYLPSSNVLQTKFMNDGGVVSVTDYLPRPPTGPTGSVAKPLLHWLVRRVEVIRGRVPLRLECAPAFNYARTPHTASLVTDTSALPSASHRQKVLFATIPTTTSGTANPPSLAKGGPTPAEFAMQLDLRFVPDTALDSVPTPDVALAIEAGTSGLPMAVADLDLAEGQVVHFVLRTPPEHEPRVPIEGGEKVLRERAEALGVPVEKFVSGASKLRSPDDPIMDQNLMSNLLSATTSYWHAWIRRSTYNGSWKEAVHRSALALKLLIFEPTGAVIASPTFSLPEYIGGSRNWDYRASWIRDSSFTLYALIRLGFTHEANAYMDFIFERVKDKNADGSLQIMYTIHGGKDLEETELTHLDGHKGSKPVRIGNGAADHLQLDIYGELMDCIYLGQKFGRPLGYDTWVAVRELVDYVVANYKRPDLSIWEPRGDKKQFTYSKVMMWVAMDRGLRLADKRSLPCPQRMQWLAARDELYEDIMQYAWNADAQYFAQSYEDTGVLDSSVLVMPLVFFIQPSDPRFTSTLRQILKPRERGGLTSNNLVFRYDVKKADDGVGGEEGTFCLCTLWCVEALTRAGEYDRVFLSRATAMFEDFLMYLNHVGLCTEEISDAGEGLGNAVQGFTHVTLISAAYNLSKTMAKSR